jgi:hypothetical protein
MKKLIAKFWAWHAARPCDAIIGPGHNYVDLNDGRWFDKFENTGEYVDGKPIQRKYEEKIQKCTKCGGKNYITLRSHY